VSDDGLRPEGESGEPSSEPAEDAPGRRTPTYRETARLEGDEDLESSNGKALGRRTSIGLPPVTVLPSQAQGSRHAPAPDAVTGPPMVVSAVRLEGTALERVLPAALAAAPNFGRRRRNRPPVVPAEILATKHVVPARRDWRLVILNRKLVPQAASMRSLRHRIADRGDPRVILVTSAAEGEGKTFCAANLALALAEVKRSRVLLVEANVENPSLAPLFGIASPPCFLKQMEEHRGRLEAPWRVLELTTYDLHVLAISPKPQGPRVLDGQHFVTCLDSLRGAYEYVVVDGPTVDGNPEIPLIEDAVDGVVFATNDQETRARPLRYAIEQLAPGDLLGVVLVER
jgi:Mrp family chromosome partitioning ATPase